MGKAHVTSGKVAWSPSLAPGTANKEAGGDQLTPNPAGRRSLPQRITDQGVLESRVHLQVLCVVMVKKETTSVVWGPHQPILS